MAYEIVVPRLGMTMEEGRIVEWFKEPGETIEAGEQLFAVETDKAVLEVMAAVSGIVYPLPDLPSEPMPIGTPIGYILLPGEEPPAPVGSAPITEGPATAVKAPTGIRGLQSRRYSDRILSSPAARRRAGELGVNWRAIERSGGGPILLAQVEAAVARRAPVARQPAARAQDAAAVTLTIEADVTELVAVREKIEAALRSREMVAPTDADLILKLTGIALGEHPLLNSAWQDDHIVLIGGVHIAVAVYSDSGLLMPVIRNVPTKSLDRIAQETQTMVQKAHAGQLGIDDQQGGTFTVTNLGVYGIDAFTPMINSPQCAALGLGRIIETPAVVGGQIVARKKMAVSLTFDHRMVDGGQAARFLNTIREYAELPYLWLTR